MASSPIDDMMRSLFEAAPDGFVVVDEAGTIVLVNATAELVFGYTRDELVGERIELLVPERVRASHERARMAYGRAPHTRPLLASALLCGRRKDGSELPVEIGLSPIRTSNGTYVFASVRDVTDYRAAERARHEAEERFRLTIEEAPIGMAVVGLDGQLLRVNRALTEMLGYAPEELTSSTLQTITHPDDVGTDLALRARLRSCEIPRYRVDKRYICKSGRVVDATLSVAVVRDVLGAPLHYIAQVEDITERKRIEEALRASEERLRLAQRVARMGSWDWDLVANTVVRTPELYALFGVEPTPDLQVPLALTVFIPVEERGRVVGTIQAAVRAGEAYSVEHRVVRSDGEERVFLQQGETVVVGGRPVRNIGTTVDITELRRAEREREAALRELRAVLEECPVGITIARGTDGAVIEPNKQARAMQGRFDPSSGLRQFSGAILGLDGAPLPFDEFPVMRALRGERVERLELLFQRSDGSRFPIEVNAAPIVDANGQVSTAVAAWQDISAIKELEQLREEWTSIVAHDLRQPVSVVTIAASALAKRLSVADPDHDAKLVERIRVAAGRLGRMIVDLLDASRIEARRLDIRPGAVDLGQLVSDVVDHVPEAVGRCVVSAQPGDAHRAWADPDRIEQVLGNLLSNALKYGEPDTDIHVDIASRDELVEVTVTNRGPGIPAPELASLFVRFSRTHEARAGHVPGLGLGLYISKGLIEAQGGHLWVESEPGAETRFHFTLPRAPHDPSGTSSTARP